MERAVPKVVVQGDPSLGCRAPVFAGVVWGGTRMYLYQMTKRVRRGGVGCWYWMLCPSH